MVAEVGEVEDTEGVERTVAVWFRTAVLRTAGLLTRTAALRTAGLLTRTDHTGVTRIRIRTTVIITGVITRTGRSDGASADGGVPTGGGGGRGGTTATLAIRATRIVPTTIRRSTATKSRRNRSPHHHNRNGEGSMHYDRWRGQWVGQAVDAAGATPSAADGTTIPADYATQASDISASNYQNALNQIQSQLPASSSGTSTSLSPTTLVIGGVLALGLIWFLTKR